MGMWTEWEVARCGITLGRFNGHVDMNEFKMMEAGH